MKNQEGGMRSRPRLRESSPERREDPGLRWMGDVAVSIATAQSRPEHKENFRSPAWGRKAVPVSGGRGKHGPL